MVFKLLTVEFCLEYLSVVAAAWCVRIRAGVRCSVVGRSFCVDPWRGLERFGLEGEVYGSGGRWMFGG